MARKLVEVTRDFDRGAASLETLRSAALGETYERELAQAILRLIHEWENSAWKDSTSSRDRLRAAAKRLVPPEPPPPEVSPSRRPPGESLYEAGLRGQRRRP